jgi:predicted transcriptional regulator
MKMTIGAGGFEEFKKRSLARAEKLDRGEKIAPEAFITFADPLHMLEVLTAKRLEIIREIKGESHSITSLAARLNRDAKSVRRDVLKLEHAGVVRTFVKVNPGHGKVRIIRATARKIQLHAAL